MRPVALAPYFWSIAAWLTATGYAFHRVLRGYLPSLDRRLSRSVRERCPWTERLSQHGEGPRRYKSMRLFGAVLCSAASLHPHS